MSVRYLLDTNTVSYIVKGNRPRVRERLLRVPMAEVGISVITEAELLFGLARRPEATKLKTVVEEFLLRVEVLDARAGDRFLLASDGLTGVVSDEELAAVIGTCDDPQKAARTLKDLALSNDSKDNVTCLVVHVVSDPDESTGPAEPAVA